MQVLLLAYQLHSDHFDHKCLNPPRCGLIELCSYHGSNLLHQYPIRQLPTSRALQGNRMSHVRWELRRTSIRFASACYRLRHQSNSPPPHPQTAEAHTNTNQPPYQTAHLDLPLLSAQQVALKRFPCLTPQMPPAPPSTPLPSSPLPPPPPFFLTPSSTSPTPHSSPLPFPSLPSSSARLLKGVPRLTQRIEEQLREHFSREIVGVVLFVRVDHQKSLPVCSLHR